MWTKEETIAWAKDQIGETDGGKYCQIAFGYRSIADWCADFDSAIKVKGQLDCPYFPNRLAFDKRDLGAIGSRWVEPYDIEAGDFISFDFDGGGQYGGDHVGYVVQKVARGDYWTVEGNCSKRVQLKHRTVANSKTYHSDGSLMGIGIIGGLRPKYAGEKADKLAVDGVFGALTIRELQTRLKKSGCYSGGNDGDFGYYSRLALQQYLRGKGFYTTAYLLDGIFGYYSVLALQKYLRKLGYYTDAYLLDGDWGKYTTIALQKALNAGKF